MWEFLQLKSVSGSGVAKLVSSFFVFVFVCLFVCLFLLLFFVFKNLKTIRYGVGNLDCIMAIKTRALNLAQLTSVTPSLSFST